MRIAFFNPFGEPEQFRQALAPYGDMEFAVAEDANALPDVLRGAEVLIIANRIYTPEPAKLIRDHGSDLRWVAFTTSGFDKAVASGLPSGVTVTNMSGLRAFAVAEHAFHLMLALMRASRACETAQRNHQWARIPLTPLMDNLAYKHLLVLGVGAIGQDIARKAKAFDMRVTGISRKPDRLPNFDAVRPREELIAAAGEADVLMVSALAEAGTFGLVSRAVISAMQPHAVVVNIARGSLIDEAALIEALKSGRLAGAGLDVQESEPVPADHALWSLDNVIITPHVAGAGSNGDGTTHAGLFLKNLDNWLAQRPLEKVVAKTD